MMYRRNGPCRNSASDFDPTHFSCVFIANTHSWDKRRPQWMSAQAAKLAIINPPRHRRRFRDRECNIIEDETENEDEKETLHGGLETAAP